MPASRRGGGPAETMPPSGRVAELERAEQDRLSLLRQLVTAQEDERRRLAANLHDDTIQALAAALLHLDVLEARADRAIRDPGDGGRDAWDAVRSSATRVRQNVEHSLQSARTFLFDLRPPVLDEAGLETALQRQLDRVAEQNDCAVELRWAVAERLDPDRETILFRAVQEALANVVKHAHAAKVAIRAWRDGGMVVVEVADDGSGSPAGAERPAATVALEPAASLGHGAAGPGAGPAAFHRLAGPAEQPGEHGYAHGQEQKAAQAGREQREHSPSGSRSASA
jgi:signal transduction histidine kinase